MKIFIIMAIPNAIMVLILSLWFSKGGFMAAYWYLSSAQIRGLSFGARSTYYSCLYLATVTDNRRYDRDIQLFDVVPASTYYRHRKEILEKTQLDLKDMFPGPKPVLVSNPSC